MSKLFAMILAFMLVLSTPSFAEKNNFSEAQVEQFTQQLEETRKRLNLTKEQDEAIKPILKDTAIKRCDIFKSYGAEKGTDKPELSFSKRRSLVKELRALKKESNEKVSTILSEEQMKEYEIIQDELRKRMREKMKNK